MCVWHRIKEEYCNFFNHDEEVKDSKNTTNIKLNKNEELRHEAKTSKNLNIKQKLSSMYTTTTQQFSTIYSSTSTLIYSSMRTLIGSVFVICKGTLLTLLIILTAPFLILKECQNKRLFPPYSRFGITWKWWKSCRTGTSFIRCWVSCCESDCSWMTYS